MMGELVFFAQNCDILQSKIDQRGGDNMKMSFKYFHKNECYKQLIIKCYNLMKKWGHLSSFHVYLLIYGSSIVQKCPIFVILC